MTSPTAATAAAPLSSSYWLDGFEDLATGISRVEDVEEIHAWYQTLLRPWVGTGCRRVLDVGCGPGRVIRAIAALAPQTRCVGIDGRDATLSAARRYLVTSGVDADLRVSDLTAAGFGSALREQYGGFDLITSLFVLHHYPTPQIVSIVRELRSLLRPGGLLILAEAHDPRDAGAAESERICAELAVLASRTPDLLLTVDALREICRSAGFADAETRFVAAPGRPFTADEAAANQQTLERVHLQIAQAERRLGPRAAASPRFAELRRLLDRMINQRLAHPVRFAPLLAVLSDLPPRPREKDHP